MKKQLIAFGIEAEKVDETIDRLVDIAIIVDIPISRIGLIYGQVKIQGRLMGADLNQFTGIGIPLIRELSKVLNVAEKEIRELSSQGEISFKHVEQAIKNMTSEGGQFYNSNNKKMKNTQSELTKKEAKEALELLQKSEGNLTNEGKEKIEQFKQFLDKK